MKTYKEILMESRKETIFHGDNYGTTKIDPKRMLTSNSNNQEGVGIYFGSLEVAKSYGKDIVKAEVDKSKFYSSRKLVEDERELFRKLPDMLSKLNKIDPESMFYFISDWIEVTEPKEVEEFHFKQMAVFLGTGQIRNLQISLAKTFGVVDFVKIWNKLLPNNLGTYDKQTEFYAIINPKVKLEKYSE